MAALNAEIPDSLKKALKVACDLIDKSMKVALVEAIEEWLDRLPPMDAVERGGDSPQKGGGFTIFRPLGTVQDDVTSDATDGEIEYVPSGLVPTAQNEPDKLDPEVESWLAMLRYILTRGDADTKEAITRNLERFHLLAQMLNSKEYSHERGGEVPKPDPDQQERMDRLREFGKRYTGGRTDPIGDEDTPRSDVPPNSQSIGKRRKH